MDGIKCPSYNQDSEAPSIAHLLLSLIVSDRPMVTGGLVG